MPRRSYCDCFVENAGSRRAVNLAHLSDLGSDGHTLINGWFDKAWRLREAEGGSAFEAFIYAWFAVNGWAACVTGQDDDSKIVRSLAADLRLRREFSKLMAGDRTFLELVNRFSDFWPIFEVKGLRRLGIPRQYEGNRTEVVASYLHAGANVFEPHCWQEHSVRQEPCPCDWPHTLAAIYRVRCNLFHGEKAAHSVMDQTVVVAALRVLVNFFRNAGIL